MEKKSLNECQECTVRRTVKWHHYWWAPNYHKNSIIRSMWHHVALFRALQTRICIICLQRRLLHEKLKPHRKNGQITTNNKNFTVENVRLPSNICMCWGSEILPNLILFFLLNIVAAFQGMHVSPAKHNYAWLPRKFDLVTGQTMDRQTPDKVIPMALLCAAMLRRRQKNSKHSSSVLFTGQPAGDFY